MPYRLCALTSAQLKLCSVRFMQHAGSPRAEWWDMTTLNLLPSANNSDCFPRTTENNEIYRRPMEILSAFFHVSDMQAGRAHFETVALPTSCIHSSLSWWGTPPTTIHRSVESRLIVWTGKQRNRPVSKNYYLSEWAISSYNNPGDGSYVESNEFSK